MFQDRAWVPGVVGRREQWVGLDRDALLLRIRRHRVNASHYVRGDDPTHAVRRQHGCEGSCLPPSERVERAVAVGALPRLAAAGRTMTDEQPRSRRFEVARELRDDASVAAGSEALVRNARRHPPDLVDLLRGCERPVLSLHRPVADPLRRAVLDVAHLT